MLIRKSLSRNRCRKPHLYIAMVLLGKNLALQHPFEIGDFFPQIFCCYIHCYESVRLPEALKGS